MMDKTIHQFCRSYWDSISIKFILRCTYDDGFNIFKCNDCSKKSSIEFLKDKDFQ